MEIRTFHGRNSVLDSTFASVAVHFHLYIHRLPPKEVKESVKANKELGFELGEIFVEFFVLVCGFWVFRLLQILQFPLSKKSYS